MYYYRQSLFLHSWSLGIYPLKLLKLSVVSLRFASIYCIETAVNKQVVIHVYNKTTVRTAYLLYSYKYFRFPWEDRDHTCKARREVRLLYIWLKSEPSTPIATQEWEIRGLHCTNQIKVRLDRDYVNQMAWISRCMSGVLAERGFPLNPRFVPELSEMVVSRYK